MATALPSCIICYDEKEKLLMCEVCDEGMCLICLESYKKLECPSCSTLYPDKTLKPNFHLLENEYINFFIFKQVPFNDQTNQELMRYFNEIEINKKLFWGERIVCKIGSNFLSCKKCHGVITETGMCMQCKHHICLVCEEQFHPETECNPDHVAAIKEIRATSKKCPCCYSYIFRSEGCPHMTCSFCGASFDWNKPHIMTKMWYGKDNITGYNKEMSERFQQKYNEMFSSEKIKPKQEKSITLKNASENVFLFYQGLKKDLTGINKTIKTLTAEYFNHLKSLLAQFQGANLSQIEINQHLPYSFKQKFYITLKKRQYAQLIINDLLLNTLNYTPDAIKTLEAIHSLWIIPNEIQFVFRGSEFVLRNKKQTTTKIKETLLLNMFNGERKEIKPLNLKQEVHIQEVQSVLEKYKLCLNTSHAGSGKTYTSLYIANQLGIKTIILFSPKMMEDKWKEVISTYNSTYNFEVLQFTYSEISSPTFTSSNNIYSVGLKGRKLHVFLKPEFVTRYLTENTLIIYDEIHNIKTPSSKAFKFICELSNVAYFRDSYILSLSATPVEKSSELKLLIKKLGLIKKYPTVPFGRDPHLYFYQKDLNQLKSKEEEVKPDDDDSSDEEEDLSNGATSLVQTEEDELNGLLNRIKYPGQEDDNFLVIELTIDVLIKQYNSFISAWCHRTNRPIISEAIELCRNAIDHGPHISVLIEQIYHTIDKPPSTAYQKEIKLVNIQTDFIIHLVLLFRLARSLIEKNINGTKVDRRMLEIMIYSLYGCNPFMLRRILAAKGPLNPIIKSAFFNTRTFNIDNISDVSQFGDNRLDGVLDDVSTLSIFLSNEDDELLQTAFDQVLIQIDNEVTMTKLETLALMTKGLQVSEIIYIPYIVKMIKTIFESKKIEKFVIGFHFKKTMNEFKLAFSQLEIPFIFIDGMNKNKTLTIQQFQDKTFKGVLLANIHSINSGVDLDDKEGDQPRLIFIIPDFKFTEVIQFMHRFKRIDSKSEPTILLLENHTNILSNLIQKSSFLAELNTALMPLHKISSVSEENVLSRFCEKAKLNV